MATDVLTPKTSSQKGGKPGRENPSARVSAADSKGAARIAETKTRLTVKAAAEKKQKKATPFPRKQLIVLCKSVAAMLDAQIPLPRALEFYNARVSKEDLRKTLQSVAAGVDRGDDNHKAFAATGRFDSTFIGLVKAGTMASNLSAALRALARRMKPNPDFQGKLQKALLTPCGVVAFLWCLLIYSMTGLVPNVEKMLKDMRVEPDAFSGAVFAFSHFFQAVYIPTTIITIIFLLVCWRSRSFRDLMFKLLLRWKLLRAIVMGFLQITF